MCPLMDTHVIVVWQDKLEPTVSLICTPLPVVKSPMISSLVSVTCWLLIVARCSLMTTRKSNKTIKTRAQKRATAAPQQLLNPPGSIQPTPSQQSEDPLPYNIKKEQPPPPQVVRKILKAENDEARTLKTVFKSNPDSQVKDFIKKAASKSSQGSTRVNHRTPAESHPPAVTQELLETDDDVADNLARLFKTSKSYKNMWLMSMGTAYQLSVNQWWFTKKHIHNLIFIQIVVKK